MKRTDRSIELHHTPATVWEYTTDLSRTPEWRTTITSIEPPAALASGERFTGTTRLLGRSWRWELQVTAVEPQRRFAYKVVDGVAKPSEEYRIEPTGAGCHFTMSGWIDDMKLAARMLTPLAPRALDRETARHLDNLRTVLDANG